MPGGPCEGSGQCGDSLPVGSRSQAAGPGCLVIECRWKAASNPQGGLRTWPLTSSETGPPAPQHSRLSDARECLLHRVPAGHYTLVLEVPQIPEFPKEIARLDSFFMETPFPA